MEDHYGKVTVVGLTMCSGFYGRQVHPMRLQQLYLVCNAALCPKHFTWVTSTVGGIEKELYSGSCSTHQYFIDLLRQKPSHTAFYEQVALTRVFYNFVYSLKTNTSVAVSPPRQYTMLRPISLDQRPSHSHQ